MSQGSGETVAPGGDDSNGMEVVVVGGGGGGGGADTQSRVSTSSSSRGCQAVSGNRNNSSKELEVTPCSPDRVRTSHPASVAAYAIAAIACPTSWLQYRNPRSPYLNVSRTTTEESATKKPGTLLRSTLGEEEEEAEEEGSKCDHKETPFRNTARCSRACS